LFGISRFPQVRGLLGKTIHKNLTKLTCWSICQFATMSAYYPQPNWESPMYSPVSVANYMMYNPEIIMPVVEKRRRRRCVVSFAENAYLYPNDKTEEEVRSCWYTNEDLACFKKERRGVIKMLKTVNFNIRALDTSRLCLRGFEAYFSVEINKVTKHSRALVFRVVLTEQHRQRCLGFSDSELVKAVSQQASQWALRNAIELGSLDAAESYKLNYYQQEPESQAPQAMLWEALELAVATEHSTKGREVNMIRAFEPRAVLMNQTDEFGAL
jgi:hypothetical protein